MSDDVLLQDVRRLRAKGASPKDIARTLRVPPAKVAPLVRSIAAQDAEAQPRPDVAECWTSPGWHDGLTFAPHSGWPVNPVAADSGGGLVTVMVL